MIKTVDSIKNQNFKDYEVWIIDGGSSKDTFDYLTKLKAPFFYQSEADQGIYDAMNKGIKLSRGDWFYFLGTGDTLKEKHTLLLSLKLYIKI